MTQNHPTITPAQISTKSGFKQSSGEQIRVQETINIHPDFQNMPALPSFINPWFLAAANSALNLAGAITWRKFANVAHRHYIAMPDGFPLSVWVIKPEGLQVPAPALVYLHGSGFMMEQVPQHIENAVRYARDAHCCVIYVKYRLAPKYRFPIPFNDCHATLKWVFQNAETLKIDTQRVAIGGDSAGGALAASVAQKAAHEDGIRLCGQLLVYPITSSACETWSSTAFANVRPFRNFVMQDVWKNYLRGTPAIPPKYASPMHGNLMGLAPVYVETGEYDPWRDEGVEYAKALAFEGIDVELNETRGTVHGFDTYAPLSPVTQAAIARRVEFLRRIFQ
jgi:acetyl esterase/lipase